MWGLQKKYMVFGVIIWFVLGTSPLFDTIRLWTVHSLGWEWAATTEEKIITHEYDATEHGTYERIVLKTEDGCQRNGVLTLRPNARGNIVLCHPATYDKEFMKVFVDKVFVDYNCIRFDFRHHGDDALQHYSTCGKKEIYEVEAALDILKKHDQTKDMPTYGFGISLGAAVLIEAESKKHSFDALILQSTFEKLSLQIRRKIPLFNFPPFRFFMFREPTRFYLQKVYGVRLNRITPMKSIQKISIPIFLMHAQDDVYIPFEAFQTLLASGGGNIVRTWAPITGGHTTLYAMKSKEFKQECSSFLRSLERKSRYDNVLTDAHNPLHDRVCNGYRMSLTATTSDQY